MHDSNQTPPETGPARSFGDAPESTESGALPPVEFSALPPDPRVRSSRLALLVWLAILVGFGVGGLLLGQQELALLAAFSGVFVAAGIADLDPEWRQLYDILGWVAPAAGFAVALGLGFYLSRSALPGPLRALLVMICACGMGLSVALAARPVVQAFARRLLHAERPNRLTQLTTRCVVLALALAVPAWFAAQDVLDDMMKDPQGLLDKAGLGGGLIGYVLLALAGTGWLVRRNLRETFERLGLRMPRLADFAVAAVAVGALWLLNDGSEWIEQRWFPASYAMDHAISEAMGAGMGPARVVLLGLSAGIGEEITMRGALQPRLGIALTSLLFATLHVQYSWFGMVVIFALGSILGLVRARTSTTAAMMAHVVYDVLAVMVK